MKKGPLYLCGAAAAAVCVLYHTLAPKRRALFSGPGATLNLGPLFLDDRPRAAASRKNSSPCWHPLCSTAP